MKQDINKKGNQQSKSVVGKMNQERVQIISISNGKTTSHNIQIFRFIQTAL